MLTALEKARRHGAAQREKAQSFVDIVEKRQPGPVREDELRALSLFWNPHPLGTALFMAWREGFLNQPE